MRIQQNGAKVNTMYTLGVFLIGALLVAILGAILFLLSVVFVTAEAAAKKLEEGVRLFAAKTPSFRFLQGRKPDVQSTANEVLLGSRRASAG